MKVREEIKGEFQQAMSSAILKASKLYREGKYQEMHRVVTDAFFLPITITIETWDELVTLRDILAFVKDQGQERTMQEILAKPLRAIANRRAD